MMLIDRSTADDHVFGWNGNLKTTGFPYNIMEKAVPYVIAVV